MNLRTDITLLAGQLGRRGKPQGRRATAFVCAVALTVAAGCDSSPERDSTSSPQARATPREGADPAPGPARSQTIEVRRGNVRLAGTLEVPARTSGGKVPLAILMHGFTGSQEEPVVRASARALLAAGIASIRFDFNAHGKSSGRMIDMTVPNEVEDAQAVLEFARDLPYVSTIGLVGHSQGGAVAAMLAGERGDDISALVLLAPAVNIPADARAGRVLGARFDPDNPPDSVSLYGLQLGRQFILTAQRLPIRKVPTRFAGPVSLIQGEDDALIPVSQSRDYVSIFDDGELHLLPGEDHDFYQDPDAPAALVTTFLKAHLR